MCSNIEIGSYAYRYLVIPPAVPILTIYKAWMARLVLLYADWRVRGTYLCYQSWPLNQLRAESIPEDVIAGASALFSPLIWCVASRVNPCRKQP